MADIGGQQTCVCLMFLFQPSSLLIINRVHFVLSYSSSFSFVLDKVRLLCLEKCRKIHGKVG